jgi:cell division protein FtsN
MKGTCEVEVERLSGPTVSRKNSSSESYDDSEVYALQAGSFETRELAECLMVKLGKEYDSVKLISEKGLFKVSVGAFEDPHQARVMKEEFINKGYQVFTVKQTPEALVLADSKTIQSCSAQ